MTQSTEQGRKQFPSNDGCLRICERQGCLRDQLHTARGTAAKMLLNFAKPAVCIGVRP